MPDPSADKPGRSPALIACLVVLFVVAGCGTLLLTGQNHHTEARIACERLVKRRMPATGLRFSGEKVRDLSATRHVVTGTVHAADRPPKNYMCTVSHAGNTWILDGLTGI